MDDFEIDEFEHERSVDDQNPWFINLMFYRPSKMSDEEMQIHFFEFDGKWGRSTKEALVAAKDD